MNRQSDVVAPAVEIGDWVGPSAQTTQKALEAARRTDATMSLLANGGRQIVGTIDEVHHTAAAIAAAVDEQQSAIAEIARNVAEAARGTEATSENIGEVRRATSETGAAAGDVLGRTAELNRDATALGRQVETFLAGIRAA